MALRAGWTFGSRLALLTALVELAADSNAVREALDARTERRKEARAAALVLRGKAKRLQVSSGAGDAG